MKPSQITTNLSVSDMERARDFYSGFLGLDGTGAKARLHVLALR